MQEIVPYNHTEIPKEQGLSTKEKLLYSAIGLVVLGGGVYFGRKLILNKVANKEENQSLEDGSPATIAKQIKMAFENDGWPGTDLVKLRSSLTEIPSKEVFLKVQESYKKLYNEELLDRLAAELDQADVQR